jgi:4-alpha-glucanotransferase
LIRAALSSVADTCIIPLQDYLGLGAESRLNTPGTPVGNWQWRVSPAALSADLAASIRSLAELYGRFLPDMACLL